MWDNSLYFKMKAKKRALTIMWMVNAVFEEQKKVFFAHRAQKAQ